MKSKFLLTFFFLASFCLGLLEPSIVERDGRNFLNIGSIISKGKLVPKSRKLDSSADEPAKKEEETPSEKDQNIFQKSKKDLLFGLMTGAGIGGINASNSQQRVEKEIEVEAARVALWNAKNESSKNILRKLTVAKQKIEGLAGLIEETGNSLGVRFNVDVGIMKREIGL